MILALIVLFSHQCKLLKAASVCCDRSYIANIAEGRRLKSEKFLPTIMLLCANMQKVCESERKVVLSFIFSENCQGM